MTDFTHGTLAATVIILLLVYIWFIAFNWKENQISEVCESYHILELKGKFYNCHTIEEVSNG